VADPPIDLRSSELAEDARRRKNELVRRFAAAGIAVMSLAAAVFCALALMWGIVQLNDVLRTAIAMFAASGAVMGVRAIDGPLSLPAPRRGASGHSDAASLGLLWLGWFAAIMAAMLLAHLATAERSSSSVPKAVCTVTCSAKATGAKASAECVPVKPVGAATC
jgi:hypothetical protein